MIILEMCSPINFFERWGHVQALHVSNDQPMLPIFRNFVSSRGFGVKDHSQKFAKGHFTEMKKNNLPTLDGILRGAWRDRSLLSWNIPS